MSNKHFLSTLLLIGLIGCASTDQQNKTTTTAKNQATESSQDPNAVSLPNPNQAETTKPNLSAVDIKKYAGLYFARLPCPNCGNVRVNLSLANNQSYDKTEEFLKSNEIFFEKGRWTAENNQITLTPTENDSPDTQSTIRHFRYKDGTLVLLNAKGRPYLGKESDYTFRKK